MAYLSAEIAFDDANHGANEADENAAGEKRLDETLENRIRSKNGTQNLLDSARVVRSFHHDRDALGSLNDRDSLGWHLFYHERPFHLQSFFCSFVLVYICKKILWDTFFPRVFSNRLPLSAC